MDWQQIAALGVVALTFVLLVRHEWKQRKRAAMRACGGDCGCSSDVLERIKAESTNSLPKSAARSMF